MGEIRIPVTLGDPVSPFFLHSVTNKISSIFKISNYNRANERTMFVCRYVDECLIGMSLQEIRGTTQVMLGVSPRARIDTTLV